MASLRRPSRLSTPPLLSAPRPARNPPLAIPMHHGKKRSRPDPGNKAVICGDIARRETSAVDPETGQRPSFPPFESAQDSETEEGPPIDARAYIMAVRYVTRFKDHV